MLRIPNKKSRFWYELQRRKVLRALAVYAATCFIIIEAGDIIMPRLGLPDWTVTLLIILAFAGLPLIMIISWYYDLNSKGISKTGEEIKGAEEEEAENVAGVEPEAGDAVPENRRSGLLSNIVIGVLFLAVVVLLISRFLPRDKFRDLRDEKGMISVAILPFENLTGDEDLIYWQSGISEYLISGLGSSRELAVSSSQVVSDALSATTKYTMSLSPELAGKAAGKLNASTYITGNYIGSGEEVSIMAKLVAAKNNELIWTCRVDGDLKENYRTVLEQLSDTLRNYLEIKAMEEAVTMDFTQAFPRSAEAYRNYINGLDAIIAEDFEGASEALSRAYEIDSSFTFAAFYMAFAINMMGPDLEDQHFWVKRAHATRESLPLAYQNWIELWYATEVEGDGQKMRKQLALLEKAAIHSRFLLFDLGITYFSYLKDYERSVAVFRRLEDLNREWDDPWDYIEYYRYYSQALLSAGMPLEARRIAELGMKHVPGHLRIHLALAAASIALGDTLARDRAWEDLKQIAEAGNYGPEAAPFVKGVTYCKAGDSLSAIPFLEEAYACPPGNLHLIIGNLLMYCRVECRQNLEECLTYLEDKIAWKPELPLYPIWKGKTLLRMGRPEDALRALEKADSLLVPYNITLEVELRRARAAIHSKSSGG